MRPRLRPRPRQWRRRVRSSTLPAAPVRTLPTPLAPPQAALRSSRRARRSMSSRWVAEKLCGLGQFRYCAVCRNSKFRHHGVVPVLLLLLQAAVDRLDRQVPGEAGEVPS